MILFEKIQLPGDVKVRIGFNQFDLFFKELEVKFKFKNLTMVYKVQDHCLVIGYLKRSRKKVLSVVETWRRALKKYHPNPTFTYKITPCYAHFPILFKHENNVLYVTNFFGLKKTFEFKLTKALEVSQVDKIIYVKSKDDIITGSQLHKLKTLKYHTLQNKLDMRIYTDGFMIEKSVHTDEVIS